MMVFETFFQKKSLHIFKNKIKMFEIKNKKLMKIDF